VWRVRLRLDGDHVDARAMMERGDCEPVRPRADGPDARPPAIHRDGWVYEEKVDGWRLLAYREGSRVRLVSRKRVDHTARFPELAAALAELPS
jgi:ATP-dependent DNA ligase